VSSAGASHALSKLSVARLLPQRGPHERERGFVWTAFLRPGTFDLGFLDWVGRVATWKVIVVTGGSRDTDPTVQPAPPVRLTLLDGFELHIGRSAVDVPICAQRVVAYLALRSRPQQRAALASALWVDVTEYRAAANLRTALWKLREIRERVITVRTNQLRLAEDVAVDVIAMVQEARDVLDARRSTQGALLAGGWGSGLDRFSRDLLPDWDEDWIVFERERVRQLRVHAVEALSELLRCSGRHAEAVEAGLAAVAADPLRESAQRVLIEAHLAEGNVAEARRQFATFRRILRDDLGVAPSPALTDLVGLPSASWHRHPAPRKNIEVR
jgi:DNA-binding SARP family transcriptional activator